MRLLLFLGGVTALKEQCVRAATEVFQAAVPDSQLATAVCAKSRPATGFWLADAGADCEQFASMVRLALHLNPKVTAAEFCADMKDPDVDGMLAAHSACMNLWSPVLGSSGVHTSLQAACEAAVPKEVKLGCDKFAAAVTSMPQELSRAQVCDHVLTTGGTWALDRKHAAYSCLAFAVNCGRDAECAPAAQTRCQSGGFSADFCAPYSTLLAGLAHSTDVAQVASFCAEHADSQQELAQAEPAESRTVYPPAATPPMPPQPAMPVVTGATSTLAAAPAPVRAPAPAAAVPEVSAAPTTDLAVEDAKEPVTLTGCLEHTKEIIGMGLSKEELARVAGEVCEKKYSPSICGNFTELVTKAAGGDPTSASEACRVAISENPWDMFSACVQSVDKVDGTELDGDAFQQASFEVCTKVLEQQMGGQVTQAPIADGCHYFAGQLLDARKRGPVQSKEFCTQLTGGQSDEQEPRSEPAAPSQTLAARMTDKGLALTAAPQNKLALTDRHIRTSPEKPQHAKEAPADKVVAQAHGEREHKIAPPHTAPKVSLLRKAAKADPAKPDESDEEFLSKFLDEYEGTAKAERTAALARRVAQDFPEMAEVGVEKAADKGGNVDNVIADFLSSYDNRR